MRKSVGTHLLVFLLIISTSTTSAASTECDTPRVMTSPCSGILLPTNAAEDGLRCLRVEKPKLRLELQHQKGLFENQKRYYELVLISERKRSEDLSSQIDTLIKKPIPDKFLFDSTVFWIFMGIFMGAGSTIAIAYSLPRG
tara:strand:+ start:828 stop:1250 length:423 start_codon:yes stop_codon:yes gene_type:complete